MNWDHLISTWAVPTLPYISYGSSIGAEKEAIVASGVLKQASSCLDLFDSPVRISSEEDIEPLDRLNRHLERPQVKSRYSKVDRWYSANISLFRHRNYPNQWNNRHWVGFKFSPCFNEFLLTIFAVCLPPLQKPFSFQGLRQPCWPGYGWLS
jgi:hypothetical protein